MKWIDLPPVWLLGALMAAWHLRDVAGLHFGAVWADLLGGALVGGGVVLMLLAVFEMAQHRTTVIPHREADRLVTTGIFRRSRNPIYLGDSMVLLGFVLYWDAVLALPVVPLFVWILQSRFVLPEERLLQRKFVASYAAYSQQTRRWL